MRTLLDIERIENPTNARVERKPIPVTRVAQTLGDIDEHYPDEDRALKEARLLDSLGFVRLSSEGLKITQAGAFLASTLEWRDEAKAKAAVVATVSSGPA